VAHAIQGELYVPMRGFWYDRACIDRLVIGNTSKRNLTVMGDCKTAECDPTIGESAMIQPIRLDHGG